MRRSQYIMQKYNYKPAADKPRVAMTYEEIKEIQDQTSLKDKKIPHELIGEMWRLGKIPSEEWVKANLLSEKKRQTDDSVKASLDRKSLELTTEKNRPEDP